MIWFSAAVISLYVEVCSLSDCGARSLVKYASSAGYCVDQLEIAGVAMELLEIRCSKLRFGFSDRLANWKGQE